MFSNYNKTSFGNFGNNNNNNSFGFTKPTQTSNPFSTTTQPQPLSTTTPFSTTTQPQPFSTTPFSTTTQPQPFSTTPFSTTTQSFSTTTQSQPFSTTPFSTTTTQPFSTNTQPFSTNTQPFSTTTTQPQTSQPFSTTTTQPQPFSTNTQPQLQTSPTFTEGRLKGIQKKTLEYSDTVNNLSFNNIDIVPVFTNINSQDEISFTTKFTKDKNLLLPIISLSDNIQNIITLNLLGGLGIFKNNDLKQQIHFINTLKNHVKFIDENPITIYSNSNYDEIYNTFIQYSCDYISVVDENNVFLGFIVKNYFDLFSTNRDILAHQIMTPLTYLKHYKTYDYNWSNLLIQNPVMDIIHNLKYYHYIPILDDNNKLHGVITLNNIKTFYNFKNKYITDKKGRLITAVSTIIFSDSIERISSLVDSGLDILFIRIDNAYNNVLFNTIKDIKTKFPQLQIIVGNVHSIEGFTSLCEIGVDAISLGDGTEFGQFSLLKECSKLSNTYNVSIINNSGIPTQNNNIFKSFVAGAHSFLIENDSSFNHNIADVLQIIRNGLLSLNVLNINNLHSILASVNIILNN